MKLLIAVITCRAFTAKANAQRTTWVQEALSLGIDVRFFLGGDNTVENDYEVILPVPDDYPNVRKKVQHMFGWAVENDYDHILKTDDDCVVFPTNWRNSGFEGQHYVGRHRGPSGSYPCNYDGKSLPTGAEIYGSNEKSFCSGFGYTLSNVAARHVANAPDNGDWAEDRFAGNALAAAKIHPANSYFYQLWPFIYGCSACGLPANCSNYNGKYNCPACRLMRTKIVVVCPYNTPEMVEHIWYTKIETGMCPADKPLRRVF